MSQLRALREAQGLSLRDVAHRAGCSHEQVRRIEAQGLSPRSDRLQARRIAEALGTTPEVLFGDPWSRAQAIRAQERGQREGVAV